jgi:uncharacterized caspase-like protein
MYIKTLTFSVIAILTLFLAACQDAIVKEDSSPHSSPPSTSSNVSILGNRTHSTSGGSVLDEVNGRRYALLIGNEKYTNFPPLDNPVNDASDMKKALESVGFNVIHLTNAPDRRAMKEAVRKFTRQLKSGDVGLFFYSGHAVQVKGENYLIPTKVGLQSESEAEYDTLSANYVLSEMDDARNDFNIVILDACRDNPFKKTRSIGAKGGLGEMGNPGGSMIAFSTAPGEVAQDGKGRNSPYTKRLKEAVKIPGLSVSDMFTWVRQKVQEDTNDEQTPWENVSLTGKFCFASCQDQAAKKREQELLAKIKRLEAGKHKLELQKQAEQRQKRLAAERRERKRQKRLAAERRERENQKRLAAEKRRERKLQKQAAQQKRQERLAAEKRREQERLAKRKAERERQERLAAEKRRERERLAKRKAERERQERLAAEKRRERKRQERAEKRERDSVEKPSPAPKASMCILEPWRCN